MVTEGHEWWTKSGDGGGNNSWTKVPHTNDGWEHGEIRDSTDEHVTNAEIANVSAP